MGTKATKATESADEAEAPKRRMRSDARRNHDRLLAVAEEMFTEYGTEASLDEIARRAGVANGTLYGHFTNRQAMLEELLGDRMRALAARGEKLLTKASAFAALTEWAKAAAVQFATYRGLGAVLMEAVEVDAAELYEVTQAVFVAGERLVARAKETGDLRKDVTAVDLFALVNAVAWVGEQSTPKQGERLLSAALDGMRK